MTGQRLNASQVCLTEEQMLLAFNGVERILTGYITPILILFGVIGNITNLTVLMTPSLRSKSNILLSALALSDCIFLLLISPHSMANFNFFALNNTFRYLYFRLKMHLIALANFASASAIWFVLAICLERLIGIKYPLSVRKYGTKYIYFIVIGTIIVTFILTGYSHISYDCIIKKFCNDTQIHSICFSVQQEKWTANLPNHHSTFIKLYVKWNTRINAALVVFLPIILVFWSNLLLIMTLRKRQKFMEKSNNNIKEGAAKSQMMLEQKITITVCAIVTCFTVTQGPSAVVLLMSDLLNYNTKLATSIAFIPQFLVILGKSMNFLLFCLSSSNFRQRLLLLTKNRFKRFTPKSKRNSNKSNEIKDYDTMITTCHGNCTISTNNESILMGPKNSTSTISSSIKMLIPKKCSLPNSKCYRNTNINNNLDSRKVSLPSKYHLKSYSKDGRQISYKSHFNNSNRLDEQSLFENKLDDENNLITVL
ncbi:G protein-coupled receptor, rhodopsin-like family and GPCR, rhodopsin-like, 7TM domain and 7TM GPCR, serpentine receptor class w (Srw) family-containing protein [Strongyloides ratti]|uniref:G protein-coupled receptor, rhodopsin-like family and GPCR, rhodopsin-like, 7TM domain and 7TM GPCR, serpentine receptor class w (Srw) family-containing protein n=1 Tax=Strongyloides ratti TaxID=34506 RepID=A0A090LEX0_STRRB|nr:G protein-coupled receptor, rhodopsin-like family and GPCR, rhodopsin-like, 7TM domain and 7TM GPCR, serpentine receptor class w (Srw) family-containing protein [Strongyloides ratti]CEF66080.1 G protein-coupled receptor, rhodopsin-like family and GPCR, rhodopsin-like, 7TM domain and 7TM GPCR, serpentine receptor class w (Srw) family-containing protein [Strongyloides ratti]